MGPTETSFATEWSVAQPQECRACHVICERVVSPWRCLRGRRTCIYAYSSGDSTYVGCLHKVFLPELDLSPFVEESGAAKKSDPYGMVRVVGTPRPQCPVKIERAYSFEALSQRCVNPGFLRDSFSVGRSHAGRRCSEAVDGDGFGG